MVKNSLNRFRRIIHRTISFSKRDLKLRTRYKWTFISGTLFLPILHILPLVVLYWGILFAGMGGIPGVSQQNYLAWLFLGALCFSIFFLGSSHFRGSFVEEKYWMTMYGTLMAPISKYYLLFGAIIQMEIEGFISTVFLLIISFIALPTTLISLFLVLLITFLLIIMGAAFGLISATFYLINENYANLFDYIGYAISFFSTYSIPYEVLSKIHPVVQWLVNMNPLYHVINVVRSIWFGTFDPGLIFSVLYIIVLTICLTVGAVYLFSKITRRYGVRGY